MLANKQEFLSVSLFCTCTVHKYIHLKINGTNLDLDFDVHSDLDFDLNSFCTLMLIFNRTRSRSPVTVEEWVAALPEENNEHLTKVEDSNITTIIITIVIIITLPR